MWFLFYYFEIQRRMIISYLNIILKTVYCFRYEQLVSGVKKFESDGLNSLKYEVHAMERKILYTWILAEIKKDSVRI